MKHLITLTLLIAWSSSFATKPKPSVAQADAKAISGSLSASESASKAVSTSAGGDATAAGGSGYGGAGGSGGDGYGGNSQGASANYVSESNFFALARSQPGASGCWGGIDTAGTDGRSGGILGIHLLNKSCWHQYLAGQEQSVKIQARLKCGDKHFRNSVAWDSRRSDRRNACINMVETEYSLQLARDNELAESILREQGASERVDFLLKERTHEREVCDERVERCESALAGGK